MNRPINSNNVRYYYSTSAEGTLSQPTGQQPINFPAKYCRLLCISSDLTLTANTGIVKIDEISPVPCCFLPHCNNTSGGGDGTKYLNQIFKLPNTYTGQTLHFHVSQYATPTTYNSAQRFGILLEWIEDVLS